MYLHCGKTVVRNPSAARDTHPPCPGVTFGQHYQVTFLVVSQVALNMSLCL